MNKFAYSQCYAFEPFEKLESLYSRQLEYTNVAVILSVYKPILEVWSRRITMIYIFNLYEMHRQLT